VERSPDSAVFLSQYYCEAGMSGAAVVTIRQQGVDKLVGLHVGTHDATTKMPLWDRTSYSLKQLGVYVEKVTQHLAGCIFGHASYTIVCDLAKVPTLRRHLGLVQPAEASSAGHETKTET
jgi:hypothetical protein